MAENAKITIDTKTGYFSIEGGAHGTGIFSDHSYTDQLGQPWEFGVCTFTFGQVRISGESEIILRGDRSLSINTVAGGEIFIGSDLILDGGDASNINGYGGRPVLNPWAGKSSEKIKGDGPGGPSVAGNWGVGASYNYGDEQIVDLMAMFKLNHFDIKLSDDEGWRLEIPGLPELTEIGSKRGYTKDESDRLIPMYGSGATGRGTPGRTGALCADGNPLRFAGRESL